MQKLRSGFTLRLLYFATSRDYGAHHSVWQQPAGSITLIDPGCRNQTGYRVVLMSRNQLESGSIGHFGSVWKPEACRRCLSPILPHRRIHLIQLGSEHPVRTLLSPNDFQDCGLCRRLTQVSWFGSMWTQKQSLLLNGRSETPVPIDDRNIKNASRNRNRNRTKPGNGCSGDKTKLKDFHILGEQRWLHSLHWRR